MVSIVTRSALKLVNNMINTAAPQIMTNAIVPMAVSFSLGYFLFKLLAMGVFLLEKGILIQIILLLMVLKLWSRE